MIRTRIRPGALLGAVAFVVLAAGGAGPASAQGAAAIAGCRAVTDPAERIACLEAAILAEEAAKGSEPAAPAPAPDSAPTPVATPAPAPAASAAPAAPVVTSSSSESAEMGSEQVATVKERDAARPRMTARVVEARITPYKRLLVVLDNGQVWRQLQAEEAWNEGRYDLPTVVEIRRSRFGGYRLSAEELVREIRVERVQ